MKFNVLLLLLLSTTLSLPAQVTINEINAAPSERFPRWDAAGQPRLGTGLAWFDPTFDTTAWASGLAPLGHNVSGLGTNLATQMFGLTPSLYARKTFTVSAVNAASTQNLRLKMDYNDGFIAYLNGKEVARARLGAAKTLVYVDQIAFSTRPATLTGAQIFELGSAANFLATGNNVLAIQVANGAIDAKGDMKLDAALELNNGILTTTDFTENFNNANSSSRTHTNTSGTITNTTTGTPPAGWLANALDPTSSAVWSALGIDQLLDPTGGTANGGNLRINLTGTAPTQPARVLGPNISMAAQWPAGTVAASDLDNTTVTFKYKAPLGFSADVYLEPVGGASTAALPLGALTGTTVLPTADVTGWWRFESHLSGANTVTGSNGIVMPNAPTVVNNTVLQASAVTANAAKYSTDIPGTRILDPLTGAVYSNTYSFDATLANARFSAPNVTALNTPSYTVEFFFKLTGEPQGFDAFVRRSEDGVIVDSATSSDRRAWQIDFNGSATRANWGLMRARVDLPGTPTSDFNKSIGQLSTATRLLVDTATGSGLPADYPLDTAVPNPKNVGNGINDPLTNIWHHVAITYDGAAKKTSLYFDYTLGTTYTYVGTFIHPNGTFDFGKFTSTVGNPGTDPAVVNGAYEMKFDEVRYSGRVLLPAEMLKVAAPDAAGFSVFTAKLSAASAATQTAFLAALNGVSGQGFRPVIQLVDSSYATTPGKELRLDDFSVTYARQTPITPFFGLGDSYQYFVGNGEPSNGLWEPNFPKVPNNPAEAGQVAPFPDLPGFSDYVELKNSGAAAADLTGWFLTDDSNQPDKWAFPNGTMIPAGGYLIVMCDDNAGVPGLQYLHTNFKLSEGGEKLRLYQGLAKRDEIDYPRQDHFHSYGRSSVDGALGYFDVATPKAANGPVNAVERCKTPDFYAADGITPKVGGFFTGAQTIIITTPTLGADIRYTIDGTEPTETSLAYGTGPLNVAAGANDKTGRVIRARAFKAGAVASGTKTATFLIDQNAALNGVPAMIFTGEAGQNFYKGNGIMAINGGTYVADTSGVLNTIWSAPNIADYSFGVMHGKAFERPLTLEWLRNDGQPGFITEAGIRIASSPYSRPRLKLTQTAINPWPADSTQKPSFNLFFREDYDNSSLSYPFLGQEYPVKDFDQLRPRAGKNDISNPFIKDELVRRVFNDMGHKSVKGQINTLYINGQYKGFFNTVERYREPYFQAHFDSTNPWDIRIIDVVEEGDATEWTSLLTTANKDLSVKANYDVAMNQIVLDEMIDYWLFNIYVAMWDWPNNNWVASRERIATGKWRLHVWDAEGSFGHGSVKPPNYNTILTDLRASTGGFSTSGNNQLFRALYASAEVRLRFADRINKWFFNGNILDDRDPVNCPIAKRKNEMTATFAPLLSYTHGTTYSDAFWTNWTTASTTSWTYTPPGLTVSRVAPLPSRRTFLFNPVTYNYVPSGGASTAVTDDISFRSQALWPNTEPVTYSQHGGTIPPGYNLTINTNPTVPAGSTIYYTTDGTDPRVWGGGLGASAQVYATPFVVPGNLFTTISSRVKNGTTNEWSALTEATFQFSTVPATAANLVVSQIMYHPPDASVAEAALGFTDKDDFEFIQLMAIGPDPVSLDNVAFNAGISFNFGNSTAWSPVRALAVGQSCLLVKKKASFRARYGTSLDAVIAGEYLGSLSNQGEQLLLVGPDGADADTLADVIRDFVYDDEETLGWDEAADGHGPALALIAPFSNPNHALPGSWRATLQWAGLPNNSMIPFSYPLWKNGYFNTAERTDSAISGANADPDGDGVSNLFEFAAGTRPDRSTSGSLPSVALLPGAGGTQLRTISIRVTTQAAALINFEGQVSADLGTWTTVPLLDSTNNGDGTLTLRFQDPTTVGGSQRLFMNVKSTVP